MLFKFSWNFCENLEKIGCKMKKIYFQLNNLFLGFGLPIPLREPIEVTDIDRLCLKK